MPTPSRRTRYTFRLKITQPPPVPVHTVKDAPPAASCRRLRSTRACEWPRPRPAQSDGVRPPSSMSRPWSNSSPPLPEQRSRADRKHSRIGALTQTAPRAQERQYAELRRRSFSTRRGTTPAAQDEPTPANALSVGARLPCDSGNDNRCLRRLSAGPRGQLPPAARVLTTPVLPFKSGLLSASSPVEHTQRRRPSHTPTSANSTSSRLVAGGLSLRHTNARPVIEEWMPSVGTARARSSDTQAVIPRSQAQQSVLVAPTSLAQKYAQYAWSAEHHHQRAQVVRARFPHSKTRPRVHGSSTRIRARACRTVFQNLRTRTCAFSSSQ
ncbi:hypothetical protein C8R44DRAFT_20850 [Mycena epipterygia]|nr:hypothetical protein C8R44DRAFT_20850 [Mycena epipterygia]